MHACLYCMPQSDTCSGRLALGAGEALLPAPLLDSGGSAAPNSAHDRLDSSGSIAPGSPQDRLIEGIELAGNARQAGVVTAVGDPGKQKNSGIAPISEPPRSFKDEQLGSAPAAAAASEPESEFQGGLLNATVEQQIETAVRDREAADAARVPSPLWFLPSLHCFRARRCIVCRRSVPCSGPDCCYVCYRHTDDIAGKTPPECPRQHALIVVAGTAGPCQGEQGTSLLPLVRAHWPPSPL